MGNFLYRLSFTMGFVAYRIFTSYFVETIGNANEEVIRAYVQDQLKAMRMPSSQGYFKTCSLAAE